MANDLVEWVRDVLNPTVYDRLDVAFPQYGFRRGGKTWVASDETAVRALTGHSAERLKCDLPYCVIDSGSGRTAYTFLALANGGRHPNGPAYEETVRMLAERVGLSVPERQMSAEAIERAAKVETQRTALETVLALCRDHLETDAGAEARHYLSHKRGLDAAALERFGIGLYPPVATVELALRDGGFPLVEDGYRKTVEGLALIDRMFEGRVIVPWNDAHGRPESIVGRALNTDIEAGKKYYYLAGSQRSAPLCFDCAQAARSPHVVLVEGIFDAIAAQVHGDARAIALGSVGLSGSMADTLARYRVRQATICLDPDRAGEAGTLRIVDKLYADGLTPFVAPPLPEGLDPDEFILAHGIDAWRVHLNGEEHGLRHKARATLRTYKANAWTDRTLAACLDEAIAFDGSITDPALYTDLDLYYWPEIIEATGVDEGALLARRTAAREKAERDKEHRAYREVLREASEKLGSGDLDGAKDMLRQKLDRLRIEERHLKAEPVATVAAELEAHEAHIARWRGKDYIGLPQKTLPTLDHKTLGLRGLMLLAAAPNVGKTTLAVQMGLDVVMHNDDAAFLFLSLEMSRWDMVTRLKSRLAEISWRTLMFGSHKGTFTDEEYKNIQAADATLRHIGPRICILDDNNFPEPTLEKVFAQVDALKARTGASRVFILVDYLQVWPLPKTDKNNQGELETDKARIEQMKKLRDHVGSDGAVMVISEAKKPPNDEKAWAGAMSDVMGAARGVYTPDMVFLLRELTPKEVQKREGIKEEADAVALINDNKARGFVAQRLAIVKARDGAERGDLDLEHHFTRSSYVERGGRS